MRLILFTVFVSVPFTVFAFQKADSTSTDTRFNGSILFTNNGFAPIPAFSFGKPVGMYFISLQKGRFSYAPDFALGFNGKPWAGNNWFRYSFVNKKKLQFSGGLNPGLFFRESNIPSDDGIHVYRNLTFELAGTYNITKNASVKLTNMYNHAFDSGTISGYVVLLTGMFSEITVSKKVFINLNPQVFYFNNTGRVDGAYISGNVGMGIKGVPVTVFVQGVQSIWTNFLPTPNFTWNVGLVYNF